MTGSRTFGAFGNAMSEHCNPRIFGITAPATEIVAVIRRGPSNWSHVGRWDLRSLSYQPGSWLKGRIFPQRSDLSPDGKWLCTMGMKGATSYLAVSRLPWLKALAWWDLGDTWGRGAIFAADPSAWTVDDPDEGSIDALKGHLGMLWAGGAVQFAVERRRGWAETADCPPRDPDDIWDESRAARLQKLQPGVESSLVLSVEGRYAAFREGSPRDPAGISYALAAGSEVEVLTDVQWADWSGRGDLLVATRDGKLQLRTVEAIDRMDIVFEEDLASMAPDPQPPPPEAARWD